MKSLVWMKARIRSAVWIMFNIKVKVKYTLMVFISLRKGINAWGGEWLCQFIPFHK